MQGTDIPLVGLGRFKRRAASSVRCSISTHCTPRGEKSKTTWAGTWAGASEITYTVQTGKWGQPGRRVRYLRKRVIKSSAETITVNSSTYPRSCRRQCFESQFITESSPRSDRKIVRNLIASLSCFTSIQSCRGKTSSLVVTSVQVRQPLRSRTPAMLLRWKANELFGVVRDQCLQFNPQSCSLSERNGGRLILAVWP